MTPARSKAALLDELRRRRQEIYELCASLIRIPSENPPGDTTALVAFVLDYLRSRGFKADVHEPKPGMPNVVATLGSGGPNLVLSGHLDEFPAGDGWTVPPFAVTLADGKIIGEYRSMGLRPYTLEKARQFGFDQAFLEACL